MKYVNLFLFKEIVEILGDGTGATATAPKLRAQFSSATCIKANTDLWYVVGDIA